MKYRVWNLDQDYPILENWCKERKWQAEIPKEMLPPQGIIVEDEEPICALGLYLNEKVKFGYMYGIFSNPKIGKVTLFKAMKMSLQGVKELASTNGIEVIITHTAEEALEKLYTRHGDMELVEKNVNQYIMNLNKEKYKNLDWISSAEISKIKSLKKCLQVFKSLKKTNK